MQVVDNCFAVPNTTNHLTQLPIPSFQCIPDQRSRSSRYRAVGYDQSSAALKICIDDVKFFFVAESIRRNIDRNALYFR